MGSQNWSINKSVTLGHIISTVLIIVSLFVFVRDLDRSIHQNTITIGHLLEKVQRNDAVAHVRMARIEADDEEIEREARERSEALRAEVKDDFKSIHAKLDRLIEKLVKK